MALILLRPEQPQQRIAAVESARRGDGEVGEQRDALGLRQHGAHFPPAAADETHRTQSSEFQQTRTPTGQPGNTQVTLSQRKTPIVCLPLRSPQHGMHLGPHFASFNMKRPIWLLMIPLLLPSSTLLAQNFSGLEGKDLTAVEDLDVVASNGVLSLLGPGRNINGRIARVLVRGDRERRLVIVVSYNGFPKGGFRATVQDQTKQAQRWLGTPHVDSDTGSGQVEITVNLDTLHVPEGTSFESTYLRLAERRGHGESLPLERRRGRSSASAARSLPRGSARRRATAATVP